MNTREMRVGTLLSLPVLCLLTLFVADVQAQPNAKQARKAITRMTGFELTSGAVRVVALSPTSAGTAEVSAFVRSVFRFELNPQTGWRVAEIRTGPDSWEQVGVIARALGSERVSADCNTLDPPRRGAAAVDPSVKRARCLLGSLLGIEIPSDALRIQEVAPFAIPLAAEPSTTVVAWIQIDARLVSQSKSEWRVSEVRTGKRNWVNLETVASVLNEEKRRKARIELEAIAGALERFRQERGVYLVTDQQSVVIDHLNPRYLPRVIRLDPWNQPYHYQGQSDRFTLSSTGPDRKSATADDIVLTGPAR